MKDKSFIPKKGIITTMTRLFYTRLAVTNIRKNSKTYFPFIVAAIFIVAMLYIAHFLTVDEAVTKAADSGTITAILGMGIWVDVIFSAIFLFYTNSFLIKRRKKEFGLFNILGMEKKHIARVLALETLIVALGSITMGILIGIAFSKLMLILLFSLLKYPIPLGFSVSPDSLIFTLVIFTAIFVGILIWNLRQIQIAKPIELLQGGAVGEREPKTRWFATAIGTVTLGIGYFIAITTQSPIQAIPLFFVAVILVMIGTYCLFSAGSILLLKLLRSNKAYYYQPSHFYSVSGMLYRMKQNAVGLANICILSVGVMVMISTTLSLYMGGNDVMRTRYPYDISIGVHSNSPIANIAGIDKIADKEIATSGIAVNDRYSMAMGQMDAVYSNGTFSPGSSIGSYVILAIDEAEYTRLTGKKPNLQQNELLYYNGVDPTEHGVLTIYGQEFTVRERLQGSPLHPTMDIGGNMNSCVIVTDTFETYLSMMERLRSMENENNSEFYYEVSFNTAEGTPVDNEILLSNHLRDQLRKLGEQQNFQAYVDSMEAARDSFFTLYGGLLFLGIFLGTLFILATVLIIYYKQVSEGYDDRERFQIMQKVGMDAWEVRSTIRSQVLTVFMLPIAVAVIHLAVAFPVLTKLLALLNLYNVPLFAAWTVVTVLVFVLFYTLVYGATAKTYYKIVQ